MAHDLGLSDFDFTDYHRYPDPKTLHRLFAEHLVPKVWADWQPGDIVMLKDIDPQWPCHMGFLADRDGEPYLIHSYAKLAVRHVTEHGFTDWWRGRMAGLWSLPGVD